MSMTNITTHRRCETCEYQRNEECRFNPPALVPVYRLGPAGRASSVWVLPEVRPDDFCHEWSESVDAKKARGLMTPAVSNALVEACKAFIVAQEAQVEQWGMDSGDYKAMLQVHADAIHDALKQQGVEV